MLKYHYQQLSKWYWGQVLDLLLSLRLEPIQMQHSMPRVDQQGLTELLCRSRLRLFCDIFLRTVDQFYHLA